MLGDASHRRSRIVRAFRTHADKETEMKQSGAVVFEGVDHWADDDVDVVSWISRKLRGGHATLLYVSSVLVLWLLATLMVTQLTILGAFPTPLATVLVAVVWVGLLVFLHRLLTLVGRESVRVGKDKIVFELAGLRWPRKVAISPRELESLVLADRTGIYKGGGDVPLIVKPWMVSS